MTVKQAIRTTVLMAVIALLAVLAWSQRRELAGIGTSLAHAHLGWVMAAVVAQGASMASLAREQRRLLRVEGGDRVGLGSVLATTYAGNAISTTTPIVGSGLAAVFCFRRFTRQGVDRVVASWTLVASGIFSAATLALITAVGALVMGSEAGIVAGVVTLVLIVVPLTVVLIAVDRPAVQRRIVRMLSFVLSLGRRLRRRSVDGAAAEAGALVQRVIRLRLSPRSTAITAFFALANWGLDILCLACGLLAVGVSVPWGVLILIWAAGAGVSSLGLTPGGLGVVEATLVAGLATDGIPAGPALAGVLVYRFIHLWLVLGAGAITLGVLNLRRQPRVVPIEVSSDEPAGPAPRR